MNSRQAHPISPVRLSWCAALLCAAVAGCSSTEESAPDGAPPKDQLAPLPADSGLDSPGATSQWGVIEGSCGVLDDQEWSAEAPFLFLNAINFADQAFDPALLSAGGKKILDEGNLGGSSIHSEILAFEVLHRCESAELLKTEGAIKYLDEGKRTDLLLLIDGHKVGVSVTRSFHYPPGEPLGELEALGKLSEKLAEVQLSEDLADPEDAWSRSILQVIAYDAQHAEALQAAYEEIEAAVKDRTLLMITVTDGEDQVIYEN